MIDDICGVAGQPKSRALTLAVLLAMFVPGFARAFIIGISGPSEVDQNSQAGYDLLDKYWDGNANGGYGGYVTSPVDADSWHENSDHASITNSGWLYVSSVPFEQTVVITAEYNGEIYEKTVTLLSDVRLDSITISGPAQVFENTQTQYTCTAHLSSGSSQDVTNSAIWSQESEYASVSSSGLLLTRSILSDQATTITATHGDNSHAYGVTINDDGFNFSPAHALNTNASSDFGSDTSPQIKSDGAGNWIAVWASHEDLNGTVGTDNDIFVSRSNDQGMTWSYPNALNTNATSDTGHDFSPEVAVDGAGTWLAVWYSDENLDGTAGTDTDIFLSSSTDQGLTWSPPAVLDTNADSDSEDDYFPHFATDGAGNWIAVWESTVTGTFVTTDISVSSSTDHGMTWSSPVILSTYANPASEDDYSPRIATDGTGNWIVVWESWETLNDSVGMDADIFLSRSTNNGMNWSAPAALNANANSDSGGDFYPQIIADDEGNWITVWYSDENLDSTAGTDHDIFLSRSTDQGMSWSSPETLNANADSDLQSDYDPQITTDGAGNWITVWKSEEDLHSTVGTDNDIFLATSNDYGVTWSYPAVLNSNANSDSGSDDYPQITTNGTGTWVVVWESTENLDDSAGTDYDIFFSVAAVQVTEPGLSNFWFIY